MYVCITDSQVLEGSKRRRRNKSDLDPDEARGRDGRETETEGPGVGSRGESGHVSPLDDGNATHGTASGANIAASLRNRASADPRRQSKVQQPSREDKLIKDKLITIPDWASSGDRTWLLRKVAGGGPGLIRFDGRSHVVVGRSSKASEQLQSSSCSGLHAIIAFRRGNDRSAEDSGNEGDDDRVCVKDLQSTHGTYVDGVRIPSDAWRVIPEGSTVTFGRKHAEGECAKYTLCKDLLAEHAQ